MTVLIWFYIKLVLFVFGNNKEYNINDFYQSTKKRFLFFLTNLYIKKFNLWNNSVGDQVKSLDNCSIFNYNKIFGKWLMEPWKVYIFIDEKFRFFW